MLCDSLKGRNILAIMMSTQLVMLHRTKSMISTAEIDMRPGHVDPSREMTPIIIIMAGMAVV